MTQASATITNFITLLKERPRPIRRDRTAKYMARVDERMACMDRDAKLVFLRLELAKWFTRYELFQTEVFSGRPLVSDATAWDYAETISTVSAKISRLERESAKVLA